MALRPLLLLATCLFLFLLPPALAQAPNIDGEDSEFLEPVNPPPAAQLPSPSPGRSAAPAIQEESAPQNVEVRPTPTRAPEGPSGPPPVACKRLRTRTLTGQCTSAIESTWGETQRTQLSYLRDHTSTIPTGGNLKSPREISNIISDQRFDIFNSQKLNELFVFFGQFIDHNLVTTPSTGESFPIPVPPGDPWFSGSSMPFTRSTRGFTGEGTNERPINTLSSALDLSAVYGVNDPRNDYLLEKDSRGQLTGKMKVSAGDLLPFNTGGFNNAPDSESPRFYLTGDHRANEHPALTSIHTIFVREHNRIVDEIVNNFPPSRRFRLSGRTLYEWARQVNIAQFQKIVYEEFLPAILGEKFFRYRGYRRQVNPTVSDIFAGAAYRVGHTMVGNKVTRRGPAGPLEPLTLRAVFFKEVGLVDSSEINNFLRGAANQRAQEVDLKVHDVLRNMLFEFVEGEEGFDLVAMNIQRGRDHALPTYNQIRTIFGLRPARSFFDITGNSASADQLARAYDGDIDAVEAWPGLVAERKSRRAGLGETMIRVWEIEFLRLMEGDQFFYLRRRKSISRQLVFLVPRLISSIFSRRTKIFRDIIVRNTGIHPSELPRFNIFKA